MTPHSIAAELRQYAQVGSSLDLPTPKRTALAAADLIESLEEQVRSSEAVAQAALDTERRAIQRADELEERLTAKLAAAVRAQESYYLENQQLKRKLESLNG